MSPVSSAVETAEPMSDVTPAGPGDDLATRGRTTIADRVFQALAVRMALEVPGVVRDSAGPAVLSKVTGSLPDASVESAGERVRLTLEVAVTWESEVRSVAAEVRSHVRSRLAETTGKSVDRVDVTVTKLVPTASTTPERRVE